MQVILLYPTLRSIMKGKTKKISITIDENVLSDIEEMAVTKDLSRSKLISKYCKQGLDSEQDLEPVKTDYQRIIDKARNGSSKK